MWPAARPPTPRGPPSIDYNIPGVPKASITGLPAAGVAIYQGDATQLIDFCEALRQALSTYGAGQVQFDNIDVSRVPWDSLNFSVFCDILSEKAVTTKRFKAYKTGLDDESMATLAEWFRRLPAQGMPSEIHLSHNKSTQDGFDALFSVLEEKRHELWTKPCPIWLRVEVNSVPPDHVAGLEKAGRILFCPDIGSCRRSANTAVAAMPPLSSSQWSATVAAPAQAQAQVVRPPPPQAFSPANTANALINAFSMGKGCKGQVVPPAKGALGAAAPGKGGHMLPPLPMAQNSQNGLSGKGKAKLAYLVAQRDATAKGKGVVVPAPGGKGPGAAGPPAASRNAPTPEGDDDDDSWGEWKGSAKKDASEEKRVHPSDKSKTPYTFAGFIDFANGDEAKAKRMWNESRVAQDTASEEKRVHPSDKAKTPYTFAGFVEFAKGDDAKAKRMWNESKVVQESNSTSSNTSSQWSSNRNDAKSWDQKSNDSWKKKENGWDKKDDKSWDRKNNNGWESNRNGNNDRSWPAEDPDDEFERLARESQEDYESTELEERKRTAEEMDGGTHEDEPAQKVAHLEEDEEDEALPPGWTKEWSEEYQIPFYWKEETEETQWERPTE